MFIKFFKLDKTPNHAHQRCMQIRPQALFLRPFAILACLAALCSGKDALSATLRPPAVPLVACDPYFSIWSQGDKLTDVDTTHWTGRQHRLTGLVRVDGKTYRVMGTSPSNAPALEQKSLTVLPTRTIYTFEGAGMELTLTFLTPALPYDLDILSWPITYITYGFRAIDGGSHDVQLSFDASGELTVNAPGQLVKGDSGREQLGDISAL